MICEDMKNKPSHATMTNLSTIKIRDDYKKIIFMYLGVMHFSSRLSKECVCVCVCVFVCVFLLLIAMPTYAWSVIRLNGQTLVWAF